VQKFGQSQIELNLKTLDKNNERLQSTQVFVTEGGKVEQNRKITPESTNTNRAHDNTTSVGRPHRAKKALVVGAFSG